jgi:hypothetical protein
MHTAPPVNQLFPYPEYLPLLAVGASNLVFPVTFKHTDRIAKAPETTSAIFRLKRPGGLNGAP